ncbi:MAG: hypothetical protein RDU89_03705 [bacterium]|nr:hypothetical protein [bacterium]
MMLAQDGPALGIFTAGSVAAFFALLVICGLVYMMIQRARAGLKIPEIRKIAGLEAIDEAIGRATEMGRPVHFTPGLGDPYNIQTIASYAMLGHVAKRCAQYDTRLLQTNVDPFVLAINNEVIRQAYLEAGRPDAFNPDDITFHSTEQFAYAASVLGLYERERPAANIMFGAFWAESMLFAEGGAYLGSIQIGATANTHQIAFFVAACDYTLIGEEMFAASAYLSKEPVLTGTVVGQDWARIGVFALIILGTILAQIGDTNWLATILKK